MKTANDLICREVAYGSDEYEKCVQLRYKVLREPLGLRFSAEQLAVEANDIQLACFQDDELVGCLSFIKEGNRAHMRQVAVEPNLQGRGVGRILVQFAEGFVREKGFDSIVLHARETAVAFYERLGYRCVGESFEEVTLPHREMVKEI